jgi:hypothetical protein
MTLAGVLAEGAGHASQCSAASFDDLTFACPRTSTPAPPPGPSPYYALTLATTASSAEEKEACPVVECIAVQ